MKFQGRLPLYNSQTISTIIHYILRINSDNGIEPYAVYFYCISQISLVVLLYMKDIYSLSIPTYNRSLNILSFPDTIMKNFRVLTIFPILFLIFTSCKTHESPTNSGGNSDAMISTTIAGVVNDENGSPVSDADVTVSMNGVIKNSIKTNKFGTFMIKDVSVPSSRCFIICKKNGYFTGSRAEIPNAGRITEMRLTMQSNATTHTVNATTGGKISIGSASISFPANAFVTSAGAPYTGTVNVAAKFLDPTSATFYNSFAGDMTATRTDGSQTELLSYGVLRVLIKDDSGNELKLAAGKTATLTYPLAASMQKNAPASMPLWYFEEKLGMWKEEGSVAKTGNTYSGDVAHFSEWNCDFPGETGTVKGRVACSTDEGISGIYVTVGERKVMTDLEGYFSCRVPVNMDFTISIHSAENSSLTAPDMKVTALTAGENRTLNDIKLSSCPATITGTIVDCNSAPTPGTVVISSNGTYTCHFTTTGIFKIRVPSGVAMVVECTTLDGKLGLPVSVPVLNSDDSYSTGTISACDNGTSAEYYDINYGSGSGDNVLISPDGSLVVITGYRLEKTFTDVYDVKTGVKLSSFERDSTYGVCNFTADGSKLLIHWGYDSLCVINPKTGDIIQKTRGLDGRISLDGSTVAAIVGYEPTKLSTFSVATGAKIKDASFTDPKYLIIIGLRGTNQIVLAENTASNVRFLTWDFLSDTKVTDVTVPNTNYINGFGISPDGSIVGIPDLIYYGTASFYNTGTGAKVNTMPFEVPGNDGKRQETSYIGVSNDNNFVIQGFSIDSTDLNSQTYLPPTTYTITDGKLQKVLASPSEKVQFQHFNYSADSRYLVGIPSRYTSSPSTFVRVWKVK